MSSDREEIKRIRTKTKVIGVGSPGGNVVRRMIEVGLTKSELYIVDTDKEALGICMEATCVKIGANIIEGRGTAARPILGKRAAEEDIEKLRKIVAEADLVIVVAGLGGGTGTGAAPMIVSLAREQGAIAVAVVTLPFIFEGELRTHRAGRGLQELRETADSVVVVPNQRIFGPIGQMQKLNIGEVFGISDEMLLCCVESILEFHASTIHN